MPAHRILIVDDQRSVRKYLIALLQGVDGEFIEAENGRLALDTLERTGPVDLVISDVQMPVLDGLTLCETLKKNERLRAIPVVIVSSFDSEVDVERGFQAGAHSYIPKSEVQAKIESVVRGLLDQFAFRKRQTILVVDDSDSIRQMLSAALAQAGFQVDTAENGRLASEKLLRHRPDLIVSDISMPEMDGYALFHWLRAQSELRDIPFVVMSVHTEQRYIGRMVEQGVAAYLIKPFTMSELILIVERLLSDQFRLLLKEREKLAVERSMLLASIASLINALEARDAYTKGHSMAVAKVATAMAKIQGMSVEETERLMIAAQLHDIGKIGIRDHILLKKGALTDEEFEAIKTHPAIGSAIIAAVPSLIDIVPVARSHHERFDGKGYPDGLQCEEIPLMARMIAVADTYDAMISNRPYRDGFVIDHALNTIRRISGSQLCPLCVDLFFQWIDQCSLPLTPPRELAEGMEPLSTPTTATNTMS